VEHVRRGSRNPMTKKPRIGIYFHARKSSGGIYQYSLQILRAFASLSLPFDVVVLYHSPDFPITEFEAQGWELTLIGPRWASRMESLSPDCLVGLAKQIFVFRRRLFQSSQRTSINIRWQRLLKEQGIALMFYPHPREESFECLVPYVLAVHDIQHRLQPEFPEVSQIGEYERREYLLSHSISKAQIVIVDSEVGKEDIIANYKCDPSKIEVLPYVPMMGTHSLVTNERVAELRSAYRLPEEFAFYPAQFWPHKNHYRIIEALITLKDVYNLRIHVVFTGHRQDQWGEFARVMNLVRDSGLEDQVRYLNYLPANDMPDFYRLAKLLLFPTFFGPTNIPILEGFALGCPVLTSDIRGIREQVGNAALLANPRSADDIAVKLRDIWMDGDLRKRLINAGFERVQRWTADDFARRLVEIVQRALVLITQPAAHGHVGQGYS
jgi:glycosyltransferase involved in cell wall biosynthesis